MNRNYQLARYSVAHSITNLALRTASNQHPFPDICVDIVTPLPDEPEQYIQVSIHGHFGWDSPYAKTIRKIIAETPVMKSTAGLPCNVAVNYTRIDGNILVQIDSEEEK
jgi:hypothetical protein